LIEEYVYCKANNSAFHFRIIWRAIYNGEKKRKKGLFDYFCGQAKVMHSAALEKVILIENIHFYHKLKNEHYCITKTQFGNSENRYFSFIFILF